MKDTGLLATVGLPAALAVIMCSLGLSLTPGDFKRVLVLPKGVAIGLVNLLVISPLLAFAIAEVYGLAPELAVGLVLMGAAPGGTMANLLTHLARGDTALSVTMTGVSSIAAVVTVPLYLGLAIDFFDAPVGDDVSMLGVVARVFAITLVPLAIGMALRARDPERADRLEPRIKRVALIVFVLVVAGAVASELERHRRPLRRAGARDADAERRGDGHRLLDRSRRPAPRQRSRRRSGWSSASTTRRSRSPSPRASPPCSPHPRRSTRCSCSSPPGCSPG